MASGQQPNKDSSKIISEEVQFEVIEDDIQPPPPHLTSKFKTLQEWLSNICDSNKPRKPLATYEFGLFESPTDFTLYLVGVNTYNEGMNRSITRVEFEPANKYFPLPKAYNKKLSRKQLLEKLTHDLKAFAGTEKFKTSFFTTAAVVSFETTGEIIWSQQ